MKKFDCHVTASNIFPMVRDRYPQHMAKLQGSMMRNAKVTIFVVLLLSFIGVIRTTRTISVTMGLLMPQASDCHYSVSFEAQYPAQVSEFDISPGPQGSRRSHNPCYVHLSTLASQR